MAIELPNPADENNTLGPQIDVKSLEAASGNLPAIPAVSEGIISKMRRRQEHAKSV